MTLLLTGAAAASNGEEQKLAKASAVKDRTQAINQLKSVLVTADHPAFREELAALGSRAARHWSPAVAGAQ
ncbi:hypothetical protein ABT072_35880 [Streptomyces sp. NPDC002589]|uniref:hypothetical protein n=1 Tax=Streptomyces sp. NPDC002589 TaxID=3154420 RepID=UPI003325AA8F